MGTAVAMQAAMVHRARIVAAAVFATSLFHVGAASAEDKINSDPCLPPSVAPSRSDAATMPKTIGGIVFQEKVISPGGALVSEVTQYALLDGTGASLPFTKTDAGRPGWVLLSPNGGLGEGSAYTVSAKIACTDGTTSDESSVPVTVSADAPLPTAIGTVRIGDSFVGAPANGGKKSFDAVVVWVKPTAELEKYLGVAAWRVTAIAPDGKPHASQWQEYGNAALPAGQTEVRLSVSAFCPAKGPQKVDVEAALPGQPATLLATSSWDVGELVCDDPATSNAAASGSGSSSSSSSSCALSTPRSEREGAAVIFAALGFVAMARRRSALAREA